MDILFKPIGHVNTAAQDDDIPRHWTVSNVEGMLDILPQYQNGLKDIEAGSKIMVLFHFHRNLDFTADMLIQTPRHGNEPKGVFSICSPKRPNPIGLSVLRVLSVEGCRIRVRGIDMLNGTPILDIKPHVSD